MADDARNRLDPHSEIDRILAQYSPPNPLYDHRSYLAEYLQRAGQPPQNSDLDGVFRRNDLMQDRSVPTGWASGRYHPEPEPLPLGSPAPLPDVRPREMREPPLGQSNFLDRVFSSFGQPSLDSLRRGLEGRETPTQVARTFMETGPVGPFGMAVATRARLSANQNAQMRSEIRTNPDLEDVIRSSYGVGHLTEAPPPAAQTIVPGRGGNTQPPVANSVFPTLERESRHVYRPEPPTVWRLSSDRLNDLEDLHRRGASRQEMLGAMNQLSGRHEAPLTETQLGRIVEMLADAKKNRGGREIPQESRRTFLGVMSDIYNFTNQ